MSQVTLEIGGRHYALACAPGEEAHVMKLGRVIDEKVREVTGGVSTGEAQSLLFAALILADELHEARQGSQTSEDIAGMLESCAQRLESCASVLEGR